MSDKTLVIQNIKFWIEIDDKINLLQKDLKELKIKKKELSDNLIQIMENNNIDEFTTNSGKLIHKKTKIKAPINKNYLIEKLQYFFKDNLNIDSDEISSYILDNRPIKENSSLIIKK
tara:strand:- start:50 stop:400 length:351 start_codon:yes stop_codon:yes gene_type:complete